MKLLQAMRDNIRLKMIMSQTEGLEKEAEEKLSSHKSKKLWEKDKKRVPVFEDHLLKVSHIFKQTDPSNFTVGNSPCAKPRPEVKVESADPDMTLQQSSIPIMNSSLDSDGDSEQMDYMDDDLFEVPELEDVLE